MSKEAFEYRSIYQQVLQPETELEQRFLQDPAFLEGLSWGTPRYGHPEGEVYKHIREVLDNIDRLQTSVHMRSQLRIIAFVHDTFKYKEHKGHPRDWSRHHSIYARKFLDNFPVEPSVKLVTELHDEAYYCWCTQYLYYKPEQAKTRLNQLIDNLGPHLDLYFYFFWSDTRTGDKNLAPLRWFEKIISDISPVFS